MSTAIARIVTPEGFVIAADGRAFDKIKQVVVSESEQKIFPVSGTRLAYSIAGTNLITRGETDDIVFDFSIEIPKVLNGLPRNLIGIDQFVENLADGIYAALSAANELAGKGKITKWPAPERDETTMILIDGHYGSRAEQRDVVFYHERPSLNSLRIERNGGRWIGSQRMIDVLSNWNDPRLAVYKFPFNKPSNLPDAISTAKKYILAYSDPEAHEIDAKESRSIGRRIHIATITTSDGFQWVPGFEP
jgi:hypothetical protein